MKNYGNYMNVYESMQLLHRAQVFFLLATIPSFFLADF